MHRVLLILGLGLFCLWDMPAWTQLPPPLNELAMSLGALRDQSLAQSDLSVVGALGPRRFTRRLE